MEHLIAWYIQGLWFSSQYEQVVLFLYENYWNVIWLLLVNTNLVIFEEGASVEELSPSDGPVGSAVLRQLGLSFIRKVAD